MLNHDREDLSVVRDADAKPAEPIRTESEHTRRLLVDNDGLHVLRKDSERGSIIGSEESRDMQAALCGSNSNWLGSQVKLEEIELTVRARNALSANRIATMQDLCGCDAGVMMNWRNCGMTTWRELLQQLLQRFIRPNWMVRVCQQLNYDICLPIEKTKPAGYNYVTIGCARGSHWILECVIADMERGKIDWCLVLQPDGIALWRKGGLMISEE